MKEIRMRAFLGIVGLAGAGFLLSGVTSTVGCSSSSSGGSSGSTGSAGSTGHGGSTGTAGTTGTGGGGGASSGGSGGGGGTTVAAGCAMSANPASATIADFESLDAGMPVLAIGGTFAYGTTMPVATVTNGAWHITLTAMNDATTTMQYDGVGIYFNGNPDGTQCVDGTAYTGVQFDISGSITGTGCQPAFSINDSEHSDSTTNTMDKKAGGPAGAYPPATPLTVTSTSTTVMVPFTLPTSGNPATSVDKMKLTGVQWQFGAPSATSACTVDITIDNVKFY